MSRIWLRENILLRSERGVLSFFDSRRYWLVEFHGKLGGLVAFLSRQRQGERPFCTQPEIEAWLERETKLGKKAFLPAVGLMQACGVLEKNPILATKCAQALMEIERDPAHRQAVNIPGLGRAVIHRNKFPLLDVENLSKGSPVLPVPPWKKWHLGLRNYIPGRTKIKRRKKTPPSLLSRIDLSARETYWVQRRREHTEDPFLLLESRKEDRFATEKKTISHLEIFKERSDLDPHLMIFHIGRCGSTVLSEALKMDSKNFVLSEPQALAFYHRSGPDSLKGLGLFQNLLRSFSAARLAGERRTIFKFSTYDNYFFRSFTEAFPQCPKVFLHRDCRDVLRSYLKTSPHYVEEYYRFYSGEANIKASREYLWFLVHHLRCLYETLDRSLDSDTLILDYSDLKPENMKHLFPRWNLAWNKPLEKKIKHRMRFYSKTNPKERSAFFTGDKNDEVVEKLIAEESAFIDQHLTPWYEKFNSRNRWRVPDAP